MKRFGLSALVLLFAAASFFAAQVDEDELKSVGQTIEFENYTGPHARVDTLEAIKGIGSGLGKEIGRDSEKAANAGNQAKYYVIHAIDPDAKEKLDADILILGASAEVDHIRNLRHIIASYLSAAYSYSEADAETIATFVTVYNAVYRKNLDAFKAKYKDIVLNNLSAEKCGLSTKWSEWPGASQIVIPVSDSSGGLSAVDTSVISDKEVVNSMKEEDGKSIDDRKQMVDIKEREAEKASEKAQEAQKQATEKQKAADAEKKNVEQKKQETKEAQKKADEAQKKADENPQDKKAQEEAKEAQKAVEEAKEEEAAAEEKAQESQQEADEAKKEAEQEQAVADKKTAEAQEERKEIAKDQAVVAAQEKAQEAAPSVYGLKLSDEKSLNSQIVKVNAANGSVLKQSPVKVIKGRTMSQASDGFVAVAGENSGKGAVKLVLIDKDSLEIIKESEEILSDNSVLLEDGGSYLVVVKEKDGCFVGKYGPDLKLQVKSPVSVNPASPIVKTSAGYMVTDARGNPQILNMGDLTILSAQGAAKSNER
ncbi:MAG: hypothetical protein IJS51_02885 [Treponema sp.]|nr:hypothetical protein [Treponema sp.]